MIAFLRGQAVDLVENDDASPVGYPEVTKYVDRRPVLFTRFRVRRIKDDDDDRRLNHLLQRRVERVHQIVGKATDESDGIAEKDRWVIAVLEAPRRRIKAGKELVGGPDVRSRQRVEERRLAGVGIPDQGDAGERVAAATPELPLFGDLGERGVGAVDALREAPAVYLDLFLTLAAGEAACAALATEMLPHPDEVGLRVPRPRQFDLEFRLFRLCASGEDLEDDGVAVVYFTACAARPVAKVNR